MTPPPRKILIIRTDRIGDVVLTLPMVAVLKRHFPHADIRLLLRSYTAELSAFSPGVSATLLYDTAGVPKSFGRLLAEIRRERFDAVVHAYPRPRTAWLSWLAGIPVRVGTGYRWYSFLFNRKVYEHRKTAEKHEAEYNLGLLRGLGCDGQESSEPRISITEAQRIEARSFKQAEGIEESKKLVIVHPGSGGSARDWKVDRFAQLALQLVGEGFAVAVTGNSSESGLAQEIVRESGGRAVDVTGRLTLTHLAAFVATADVFVSNSTGPLHIAAGVGTPVVAFYPPVTVMSDRRWGPRTEKKIVLIPDRASCTLCRGGACQGDTCMDQISVEQAAEAVRMLVKRYSQSS